MTKFGARVAYFCLAILFTGCPTPPKQQPRLTPLQQTVPAPEPEPSAPPVVVKVEPTLVPSPPATNSLAIVRVPETPAKRPALTNWLAWQSWSQSYARNNAPRPAQYQLQSTNGVLGLKVGYREATWNGSPLALGFPAVITNGHAHIHELDALKNFQPLLSPEPLFKKERPVVVLDPGHGGENPGAHSAAGPHHEKDLTLDWALRIQKLLAGKGWKVCLTRTNDADISLPDRVAIADNCGADLFISLHFNSLETNGHGADQNGLETYCLTPVGMSSTLTRAYDDNAEHAYPNNNFDSQNLQLAMKLHRSLVLRTGCKDRGVRRARFMTVVREQNRPAVLLEGGYLSNHAEARLLETPAYREKLAEAVVEALTTN